MDKVRRQKLKQILCNILNLRNFVGAILWAVFPSVLFGPAGQLLGYVHFFLYVCVCVCVCVVGWGCRSMLQYVSSHSLSEFYGTVFQQIA